MRRAGWAVAALRAAVTLALAGITAAVALVFVGKIPLGTGERAEEGTPFYVLAYHYGYAFYDRNFKEVEKIEVKVGETVTLHVVPALALPKEVFLDLGERSVRQGSAASPRAIQRSGRRSRRTSPSATPSTSSASAPTRYT